MMTDFERMRSFLDYACEVYARNYVTEGDEPPTLKALRAVIEDLCDEEFFSVDFGKHSVEFEYEAYKYRWYEEGGETIFEKPEQVQDIPSNRSGRKRKIQH